MLYEISTCSGRGQLIVEITDDILRATAAVNAMAIAFRKTGNINLLNLPQLILSELSNNRKLIIYGVNVRTLSEEEYEKWQKAF